MAEKTVKLEDPANNRMGSAKMLPLILTMALPAMFSMLIQALYNIVDSYFVAQVSQNALTAVSLAFPIQNLLVAFGVGTGVGVSSLISRRLGERDQEAADNAATHGIILSAITYVVFAIFGAIVARPFTALYTQDAEVLSMGTTYITIVTVASFGFFFAAVIEKMLQATGSMVMPMIIQLVGAVANIIFDPILIFNFNMGVAGAAIATVVSQLGSGVLCVWYMRKHFEVLRMEKDDWRLRKTEVLRLLGMGVPVGLQFSITAIGSMVMQSANNGLGSVCVSGFTAGMRIKQFTMCPFDAFATAASVFCSQNLGAGKADRIKQGLRQGIAVAVGYGAFAGLILIFAGRTLSMIFVSKDSVEVLDASAKYLRCMGYFYWTLGILNVCRMVTQGLGYSGRAVFSGVMEMLARTIVSLGFVGMFGFTAICFADQTAWVAASLYIAPTCLYCIRKSTKKLEAEKAMQQG